MFWYEMSILQQSREWWGLKGFNESYFAFLRMSSNNFADDVATNLQQMDIPSMQALIVPPF